jgi:uncharacterized repeat protein (TIGR01451 family)
MRSLLVLILLAFSFVGHSQIINFPDPNFKNALVNTKCVDTDGNGIGDADADLNDDGELSLDEASKIENLNLYLQNIQNLEGIENFKNLARLECSHNKLTLINVGGLPKLSTLNCNNNKLTSLNVQGSSNLRELNCSSNQLTSLNVQGLTNLSSLNCWENQLKSLNVQGLTNLTYFICSYTELTSLDVQGLTNLNTLGCAGNQLTTLNVQGLSKLESLYCSENQLTSLDVQGLSKLTTLYCWENQLTSLDVQGLTNLKTLIYFNNRLTTLFIKGTNMYLDLDFNGNPNLNYICCNEDRITSIKSKAVANGQVHCEVNSYCSFTPGGKFYVLKGKSSYDLNNNGCDDLDMKLSNTKYNLTKGNIKGSFISNSSGSYFIPVQAGTHKFTPILENPNNFEVLPSSITITFPSTSDTITQDFCITPKGIFRQTNITVIPLTPPARPGFDASYKIVWENVGNQVESGTLNFTYDERLLDYISATQSPDQVAGGIVKWNFSNLLPFEKREITVTLKVNRPTDTPAVNAGDKLYLTASILDNIFTLENTVVGSYDPNDKTCLQGDRVKPDMVGKYVDYLIRFENTGNYAAENVVIKDIIDTKTFDVSSLQITDASHEVYTRIEGNKVEFIFENIQLPFDDANNDGYVAFKIKTLPTLVLGDSLKNLADIYFDYNFPIRTNEAQTTISLPSFTKDVNTEVNVYPNPVRDILYLESDENWSKVEIFDISGRILRSGSLYNLTIDVSGLDSGTYFVRLKDGERVGVVKFVKI